MKKLTTEAVELSSLVPSGAEYIELTVPKGTIVEFPNGELRKAKKKRKTICFARGETLSRLYEHPLLEVAQQYCKTVVLNRTSCDTSLHVFLARDSSYENKWRLVRFTSSEKQTLTKSVRTHIRALAASDAAGPGVMTEIRYSMSQEDFMN